jgi:hypothetical protein
MEVPSAAHISMRTRSPKRRNGVTGLPVASVSSMRVSARHEDPLLRSYPGSRAARRLRRDRSDRRTGRGQGLPAERGQRAVNAALDALEAGASEVLADERARTVKRGLTAEPSYAEAKNSGQISPLGQADIDGLGSLASGLVYDPSGEIALPPNQRSKAWTDGPGATELGIDRLEVHHIFGPYYQWFHD